jgi:hypothetical protein
MYWMYDTRGRGDSGGLSCALWKNDDGAIVYEDDARPRVGVCMRVGSRFARTMQSQDFWTTTPVTEILEESDHRVLFKTKNSIYEWKDL